MIINFFSTGLAPKASLRFGGRPATPDQPKSYDPRQDYQDMFTARDKNGAVSYLPAQYWNPADLRGLKVLDLGSWDGELTQAFRNHGIDAFALDLRAPKANRAPGAFIQGNARQLPLADESLDVIYSTCSLFTYPMNKGSDEKNGEKIITPDYLTQALQEIERILKPGGTFRVTPVDPQIIQRLLDEMPDTQLSLNASIKVDSQQAYEGDDRNYFVELVKFAD